MSLFEMLKEELDFINKAIESLPLREVHKVLEVPARYMLLMGGKRLRPLLCVLSAELVGGDYRKTEKAFLALELIHNGTLVHDDIIDEDLLRRGKPSVHVKFGGKRAVLTGDILLSLGLRYAAETGNIEIVRILSETASKMVQGVALQTFLRRRPVSEERYLEIAYLKSGAMFEASAILGGLLSTGQRDRVALLGELGKNFGVAYQIRDDIAGVFSDSSLGKPPGSDIINGDPNLPLIYAVNSEEISEEDRRYLMKLFEGGKGEMDIDRIRSIYIESGALEKSIKAMELFAGRSRESLAAFGESEAKRKILSFLDYFYRDFKPKKLLASI